MLRLFDPRTGHPDDLPHGPLRLQAHGPRLRVHLVADLLRRTAERFGHRVVAGRSAALDLDRPAEDFNVRPMDLQPSENATVHVSDISVPGRCVTVAEVTGEWAAVVRNTSVDPLAVRLAMLTTHYREPFGLGPDEIAAAAERLAGWRSLVADWSRSPGRAMNRPYAEAAQRALGDDLDMAGALTVLDRLADDAGIPAGAKLETFIHLDLLLGLDLVRDIGR